MQNIRYIAIMGLAAVLSLLKGFVLAAILSPPLYAAYSSIMGLSGFIANGLSFGLVEKTVKQFPRLSLMGNLPHMLEETRKVSIQLAGRAGVFAFLSFICFEMWDLIVFKYAVIGSLLAFGIAAGGLLASVQRALFRTEALAYSNLSRAMIGFLLAAFGGWIFSLKGALAGECASALLGILITYYIIKNTLYSIRKNDEYEKIEENSSTSKIQEIDNLENKSNSHAGILVFISYTLLSIPIYLDKLLVNHVYGEDAGAAYAFSSLLFTISMVVTNILAQKVGPRVIAMQKQGMSIDKILIYIAKWSSASVLLWAVFLSFYTLISFFGILPSRINKYDIPYAMLMGIFLLGVMQFTSMLEYLLLAFDREKDFLKWTVIFILATIILSAFIMIYKPEISAVPYLMSLSKLIYVIGLSFGIIKMRKSLYE